MLTDWSLQRCRLQRRCHRVRHPLPPYVFTCTLSCQHPVQAQMCLAQDAHGLSRSARASARAWHTLTATARSTLQGYRAHESSPPPRSRRSRRERRDGWQALARFLRRGTCTRGSRAEDRDGRRGMVQHRIRRSGGSFAMYVSTCFLLRFELLAPHMSMSRPAKQASITHGL